MSAHKKGPELHAEVIKKAKDTATAGRTATRLAPLGSRRKKALKNLPQEVEKGKSRNAKDAEQLVLAQEEFLNTLWPRLIAMLQEGVKPIEALEQLNFPRYALYSMIRSSEELRGQYEEAKNRGLWKDIDLETIEEIMADVATGGLSIAQACEKHGTHHRSVTRLCLKDHIVKAMYDDAQDIRMEQMAYDVIQIGDDASDDLTWDGKGNNAAVARARLQSDNRKWILARLSHKRYGDRIKQEVDQKISIDVVNRLTDARKRVEKLHKDHNNSGK